MKETEDVYKRQVQDWEYWGDKPHWNSLTFHPANFNHPRQVDVYKRQRIAYDLPENWIKKLMLKNINIYAFINNALTWTNYSGFDPEFSTINPLQVGKDSYRYPRKREYGIGFSANF